MTVAPLSSPAPAFAPALRWPGALPGASAALLFFALASFIPAVLNDGDTFWHIAAGEWILAHRSVPTTDPFTFSMPGGPWTAHEWLSEVLMALSYRIGGWSCVVILTGAAVAAAAFALGRRLARDLDGPALVMVLTLGLSLWAGGLLARPHILALPLLAFWAAALFDARDDDRPPPFALLPLMTVWANMHGSFLLGLALLGPLALDALVCAPEGKRIEVLRGWVLFGLLALGAAMIHPEGVHALLFPLTLMGMKSLSGVVEWRPEPFDRFTPLELNLLALIGFALHRRVRVAPVRLILLVGLIHLALHHQRHALILGLLAPMILARPVAEALDQHPGPWRPLTRAQIAAILAGFVALAGIRLALPVVRENGPTAPIAALAAVPAELRAQPVLNHYNFGGYLIFSGVKPYVDGRTDMFGDAFLANYDRIAAGDAKALDEALEKFGVTWTMFPPREPVTKEMEAKPGWTRLFADDEAVIHVRKDAAPLGLRK
jgi:hypothetical protein